MKIGARNQIVGTVTSVKKGNVMAQVGLNVSGPVDLTSVMTVDSLEDMRLEKGDKVRVVVKAIHVLLVKE
jgi:molybdate transport system regulatory protein